MSHENSQFPSVTQSIIGHIKPILHPNPAKDWLLCDGTQHQIDNCPELFAGSGG